MLLASVDDFTLFPFIRYEGILFVHVNGYEDDYYYEEEEKEEKES